MNEFDSFLYSYLLASMGLLVIWSFVLALLDAYTWMRKKVLHNAVLVSLFVVGDWVSLVRINFAVHLGLVLGRLTRQLGMQARLLLINIGSFSRMIGKPTHSVDHPAEDVVSSEDDM
ncbi:hypothetical protein K1719_009367 [Acacia pycnantha]|nr:hypothetical protein K1719_009367 [Acacia pycnantha]